MFFLVVHNDPLVASNDLMLNRYSHVAQVLCNPGAAEVRRLCLDTAQWRSAEMMGIKPDRGVGNFCLLAICVPPAVPSSPLPGVLHLCSICCGQAMLVAWLA